jgi:glutamyl-tRNA reductase
MKSLIPDPLPPLRLLVIGLNHRTAPLDLRETVAFTPAQAEEATDRFRARFPQAELVILSTCNRVEFYIARPISSEPLVEHLAEFIGEFHRVPARQLRDHLYHHEDLAMVRHLFSVASSLDSMVVGETQILSQVKHAYQHGCNAGGVNKVMHALFQRALAAAKEVHEKTSLSSGRLSVASVAVDLSASVFDRFDDKTVVSIGAGKMATLMLQHMADLKPRKLLVTNRSAARAEALAARFQGEPRPYEALDQLLAEADILLTSTGAAEPIVTEARFRSLLKARRYRPIVMVDIAVPRDIEPSVGALSNVYLYNIDDLQEVAARNRGKRDQEIAASRALLDQHVQEFLRWFAARDVGPVVKALYEQAHATARAELDSYLAKNPQLSPEQSAELEKMTHRLVGKLLHGPVTNLTAQTEATARPMLTAALKKLFNLGE